MELSTVTLLSFCSTGLFYGDESFLDYDPGSADDYEKICAWVKDFGHVVDMGEEYFGWCEATNTPGTVAVFTFALYE